MGAIGPGERREVGTAIGEVLSAATRAPRDAARSPAAQAVDAMGARQILFGDLHVH